MFIVGIDFGNEYSQVCYYNFKTNEPESVNFSAPAVQYRVPTVVLKEKNKEGWLAGEVAVSCHSLGEGVLLDNLLIKAAQKEPVKAEDITVMPIELITVMLEYLIQSAKAEFGDEDPDKICVTLEEFDISVLKVVDKALERMGYGDDKVIFSSHVEAYAYYALSQKPELWKNDNVLFEYDEKGLRYCRIATVVDRGTRIVMSELKDYSKQVPYMTDMDKLQVLLLEVAQKEFDKKAISTVYLTGAGFGGEFECERFINYVCSRRRVFAGQNLYAKGACYQAYEAIVGDNFKNVIMGCNERITTGIEMKICDRGVDKIFRMVIPGTNWYKADCSYDFIVDDCEEVELFLSPIDMKEKQLIRIPLTDFPKRENKTTRITVSLIFTNDKRCRIMIADKGFGEFVKSSKRVINEELLL